MADIFDLFRKIEGGSQRATGAITHIIVGLGNPGAMYENTRHNAGFLALDAIAKKCGIQIDRARFHALTGEGEIAAHRVLLLKPQTFMNLSGEAVREAAAFYHIPPENIIVLSDDINLDVGRLRVRAKGSDGGHNGIKNIILQLNSDNFPRVRIGVGAKPHPQFELADWVLSAFSGEDLCTLAASFDKIYEGLGYLLKGDVQAAMQHCNGK